MHSVEALPQAGVNAQRDNAPCWAHHHLRAAHSEKVVVFLRNDLSALMPTLGAADFSRRTKVLRFRPQAYLHKTARIISQLASGWKSAAVRALRCCLDIPPPLTTRTVFSCGMTGVRGEAVHRCTHKRFLGVHVSASQV